MQLLSRSDNPSYVISYITLYNDQPNAQVFNLFIYLFLPYMFRLSLAHLQRQVYNFGSGSIHLGMVSAPESVGDTSSTPIPEAANWHNAHAIYQFSFV
jgi:hypothetical protein